MRQHGVEFPPNKSYFHLSEDLYKVVEQSGFKDIKHIYTPVWMNFTMELSLNSILVSPFYQKLWNSIDTKTQNSIKNKYAVIIYFYSFIKMFTLFKIKFYRKLLRRNILQIHQN